MTPRLIAFVIVVAFVLAAMAASEYRATNAGLPLVSSAAPQGQAPPVMLYAPCPVMPRNFPHINIERKA